MSIEDFQPLRQELHTTINDALRNHDTEIRRVTGWVLIAETVKDGRRNLLGISGDIVGDHDVPPWTLRGWLDEVRDDVWGYFGPESDEDE